MIIVTGADGFIGSRLIRKLNNENFNAIIAVDKFNGQERTRYLNELNILEKVDRDDFIPWLDSHYPRVEFIFHFGTDQEVSGIDEINHQVFNFENFKVIWESCVAYQIPLIYASSAETYGMGELGFDDDEKLIAKLQPVSPLGRFKHAFDKWAISEQKKPFYWAGLKLFEVYGPHEDHITRQASFVLKAYHEIKRTGKLNLTVPDQSGKTHGQFIRDLIHVDDVAEVCYFLMHLRKYSGIYNLGSGKARSYGEIARLVFRSMDLEENIDHVPISDSLSNTYPVSVEARMEKLRSIGYDATFIPLEEGVGKYINEYLI